LTLINPRQIFPVPLNLLNYLNGQEHIFTLEDNVLIGGYGAYLSTVLVEPVTPFALSHSFIEHGDVKKLYRQEGLDVDSLVQKIKEALELSHE
jgi:deoxyxylulose-5-phosphate synthase